MAAIATGLSIGLTAGQTISSVAATKDQARFQANVANANASMEDMKAEDAIRRGDKEAAALRIQTKKLAGAQRAAYAGQGVDINTGSAGEVQAESQTMGALDAITIKNNAWREAWGYRVQAENYRSDARFAKVAARNARRNTILTGGLQAINAGLTGYSAIKGNTKTGGR